MSWDSLWLVFVVIGPLPFRFQSVAVLEMLHVPSLILTSSIVFVSSVFFFAVEVVYNLETSGECGVFFIHSKSTGLPGLEFALTPKERQIVLR